jgi:hypothetical protein
VNEVDDAIVVLEVVVRVIVTVSWQVNCIGTSELAIAGEANAKTETTSSTYLTQLNPSTQPKVRLRLTHIRLTHVPPCKAKIQEKSVS